MCAWEMKAIDEECESSDGCFHELENKVIHFTEKTQVEESQSNRIGNVYCYRKASSDHSGLLKVAHEACFLPETDYIQKSGITLFDKKKGRERGSSMSISRLPDKTSLRKPDTRTIPHQRKASGSHP